MTLEELDRRGAFVKSEVTRVWITKKSWVDLKKHLNTRERASVWRNFKADGTGSFEANYGDASIDFFAPWVRAWGGPAFCLHNGEEGHECTSECAGPPVTQAAIDNLDPDISTKLIDVVVDQGMLEGLFAGKGSARSANGSTTRSSEVTASSSTKRLASSTSPGGSASRRKR